MYEKTSCLDCVFRFCSDGVVIPHKFLYFQLQKPTFTYTLEKLAFSGVVSHNVSRTSLIADRIRSNSSGSPLYSTFGFVFLNNSSMWSMKYKYRSISFLNSRLDSLRLHCECETMWSYLNIITWLFFQLCQA